MASANNIIILRDTDKSRYFAITEFNNCFVIQSPSLFFNEYLREVKQSAIFHARVIVRRRKVWFHLCVSGTLFAASQTWLDDIAHEQTIIILYAVICTSRGGLSANEKEEQFALNDNDI